MVYTGFSDNEYTKYATNIPIMQVLVEMVLPQPDKASAPVQLDLIFRKKSCNEFTKNRKIHRPRLKSRS